MSIHFLCTRCHSTLQVPEEIRGRKAQCPHCGEIQVVPQESAVSPPSMPDAMPGGTLPTPPPPPVPPASISFFTSPPELAPTKVRFGDLFQNTWDIFSAHLGEFLILGLIAWGLSILVGAPAMVLSILHDIWQNNEMMQPYLLPMLIAQFSFNIAGNIFGAYIQLGCIRYALHLVRGRESRLSLMFPGLGLFLKHLAATILVGLLSAGIITVVGGLALFMMAVTGLPMLQLFNGNPQNPDEVVRMILIGLLPAVLIAVPLLVFISIRLAWFVAFIADRNEGPLEAIQSSFRFSRGNFFALFGLGFTYGVLGSMVLLCTCGIGWFIAMPLFHCYTAVAYLMMTGQPVANPKQVMPYRAPYQPPSGNTGNGQQAGLELQDWE